MKKINTKKYENIIKQVQIDDRENNRKKYAMEQYAPLKPSINHLEIGDYIFKGHNDVEVVWEYKKGTDFLSSMDNHLHNQTYDMIHNYDYTFVIIESTNLIQEMNDYYYSSGIDVSISQINGLISELNTVSTVCIVQTQYQAFDLMMRTSGKIIQQKPFKFKFGKKTTNSALNYLTSIKGLEKKAEDICRKLKLTTHKDLMNLTKEDLTSVDGIGGATAEKILKNLGYL